MAATRSNRFTLAERIKPVVGTESCQAEHMGYVMSDVLHVKQDDDSEGDAKTWRRLWDRTRPQRLAGGRRPAPFVEFQGAEIYAKA